MAKKEEPKKEESRIPDYHASPITTGFLTNLHRSVIVGLKRSIPAIQYCDCYPTVQTKLPAPAIFVELASFEADQNLGTDEIMLNAKFEARIVVDSTVTNAYFAIRELAVAVAAVVANNRWGCNVSPAELTTATADNFSPELSAYLVWLVEWSHKFIIGTNVWSDAGYIRPHTVYAGIEPETGIPHQPKYVKVAPHV